MKWIALLVVICFQTISLGAPLPAEPHPNPTGWGYVGLSFRDKPTVFVTITFHCFEVDTIDLNAPAFKSGIRNGDIVTKIGKLQPTSIEDAVKEICIYRPGTVLEFEIVRNNIIMKKRIKLTSRPENLPPPIFVKEEPEDETTP